MNTWQFHGGMALTSYHHSEAEPMEVDEEVCRVGLPDAVSAHTPFVTSKGFHGQGREKTSPSQELQPGNFPDNWIRMNPGTTALAVVVEPNTEDYINVAFQFMSSLTFPESEIIKIFRIQNPFLWQHYALKHQEMMEENSGKQVLEKHLFHGTRCSNIDAICRKGFDWRVCGRHGTKYGQGCYFARNSRYSHIYSPKSSDPRDRCDILHSAVIPGPATASALACTYMDCTPEPSCSWTLYRDPYHQMLQQPTHSSFDGSPTHLTSQLRVLPFQPARHASSVHVHSPKQPFTAHVQQTQSGTWPNDSRYMFLARVLVGNMVRGHPDYRRPPAIEPGNPLTKHYDSCVDCLPDPWIYVIFDSNQVYPEYIVEYKYMSKKG